jgi:hypothetical protein
MEKSAHDFGVIKNIHSDKLACNKKGCSSLSRLPIEGTNVAIDGSGIPLKKFRVGLRWRSYS